MRRFGLKRALLSFELELALEQLGFSMKRHQVELHLATGLNLAIDGQALGLDPSPSQRRRLDP